MGETTGISWTDSTMNFWIGCTKVGPGCDHCYAVNVGARSGVGWGAGEPRRLTSESNRNNPHRWQRKADKFMLEHGRHQRVFCSSLADIFDNEVPAEWRAEAFATMEATPDLRWQLCTKRVSNIEKMVPWYEAGPVIERPIDLSPGARAIVWPRNVGVLITTVTPEEIRRDVPRLVALKKRFGIPWVGLSIEPMIADVADALLELEAMLCDVDWLIFGGESGAQARPCYLSWIIRGVSIGKDRGCSVFVKQLGADCRYAGETPVSLVNPSGKDPGEWPVVINDALRTFEFPAALS